MLFVIALALTTYEIFSVNELRDSIQRANTSTLSLLLAEHATYRLGGSPLVIDGRLRVQISGREGTVVDAAGLSRAFIVAGGGSLELRSLSVIRGVANASDTDGGGGCVVVRPDSALRATDVLFSECAAVTNQERGWMAAAGHTMARNALADFNIRGGADGGGTDAQGGAIASHGGTIWLEGCTLRNASALDGGAIFVWGGSLLIEHSRFLDSSAAREAGCIAILEGAAADVRNATLRGCSAGGDGGGIFAADGAQMVLADSFVEECTAEGSGGALALDGAFVEVHRSELRACMALESGGGVWAFSGMVSASDLRLQGCGAEEDGGGMYLLHASARLLRTNIEGCAAGRSGDGDGDGGGLAVHGGTLTASEVRVVRCSSVRDGGGMHIGSGALVVLTASLVQECQVYLVRGRGSAVFVDRAGALELANSSILRCHSRLYGTAYVEGNLTLSHGSELADCDGHDMGLSGSSEDSRRGGVLWIRHGGVARLLRSRVADNRVYDLSAPKTFFAVASVDAGARLEVFHSLFENNSITSVTDDGAAAVYVHSGGELLAVGMDVELACGATRNPAIDMDGGREEGADAPPSLSPEAAAFADYHGVIGQISLPATQPAPPAVRLFALRAWVTPACEVRRSAAQVEALVLRGQRPARCDADPAVCAPLAICSDEAVVGGGGLTAPSCSCEPPNVPASGAPDRGLAAVLPEFGCLTPRFASDVTVLDRAGTGVPHIVMELTKTSENERATRSLLLHVGGTQEATLRWSVDPASVPSYLRVAPLTGTLGATDRHANFLNVSADSAGMWEELEPLLTTLNVTVDVGGRVRDTVLLPIYTIIATTASAATSMWGLPQPDGRCVPREARSPEIAREHPCWINRDMHRPRSPSPQDHREICVPPPRRAKRGPARGRTRRASLT